MRLRPSKTGCDDKKIINAYLLGLRMGEIAKLFPISRTGVLKILKMYNISRRPHYYAKGENNIRRVFTDKQEIQMCEEYKNGLTGKQIAEKYKTNAALVSQMLKRHGYKSRGYSCKGIYSSRWNGGVTYCPKGYKRLYLPDYKWAHKGGWIQEHRYIMQEHLGRQLAPDEVVHHINGIKTDNRLENLEVMSASEHNRLHNCKH